MSRFLRQYVKEGGGTMVLVKPDRPYGKYIRVVRFGGWQAQWLASVIMMTGQGESTDQGMKYYRDLSAKKPEGCWVLYPVHAHIYTIGIVDIDEGWLTAFIPDGKQHEHFMKGRQSEFFADSKT